MYPFLQKTVSLASVLLQLSQANFPERPLRAESGAPPSPHREVTKSRNVELIPVAHFVDRDPKEETIRSQHDAAHYLLGITNALIFDEAARQVITREQLLATSKGRWQEIDSLVKLHFKNGIPTNYSELTEEQRKLFYYPGAASILLLRGLINSIQPTLTASDSQLISTGTRIIGAKYGGEAAALNESPEFRFLVFPFKEEAHRRCMESVLADPRYKDCTPVFLVGVGHSINFTRVLSEELQFTIPKHFHPFLSDHTNIILKVESLLRNDRKIPMQTRQENTEALVNSLLSEKSRNKQPPQ